MSLRSSSQQPPVMYEKCDRLQLYFDLFSKETKGCTWIFMALLLRLFVTADEQLFRF